MENLGIYSLAFSAGLISFMNPCGFAMLPAYIMNYLSKDESPSGFRRILNAIPMALFVSLGFISVFVSFGLLFSYVSSHLKRYVPILSLSVGIILVIIGIMMLFGFDFSRFSIGLSNLGDKLRNRKKSNKEGVIGFVLFGVGYALASLSCTLPIFIMLLSSAITLGNFFDSVIVFIMYSIGMSLFMLAVTIMIASAKMVVVNYIRGALRYMKKISAIVVIFAGAYIIYYQLGAIRFIFG